MRNIVTRAIAALAIGTALAGTAVANEHTDSAQARLVGVLTDNRPVNTAMDNDASPREGIQDRSGFVASGSRALPASAAALEGRDE